jgi:phage shock protein A
MVAFKINFDLKINEANETLKNTEFFSENTIAEKRQLDDEYNKLQVCI